MLVANRNLTAAMRHGLIEVAFVVRDDLIHFFGGTQNDSDPFVKHAGSDLKNAVTTVSCLPARLLSKQSHRVGLIHQPQLARTSGVTSVPRVKEYATTHEDRCTSATIEATQRMLKSLSRCPLFPARQPSM